MKHMIISNAVARRRRCLEYNGSKRDCLRARSIPGRLRWGGWRCRGRPTSCRGRRGLRAPQGLSLICKRAAESRPRLTALAIRPTKAHAAYSLHSESTRCGVREWDLKHMIKDRRVVARRLFDALCAQYPDKYIALIRPRDVQDGPPDLTAGKAPPAR
jgi:hypothetical protein